MSITSLSGCAIFAPMAAGYPKPIAPSPADVMKVRGERKLYWPAHIWCWPTPVVMIASPLVSS